MPRVLLAVGAVAVIAALVSIAVGEGGPGSSQEIGGINEIQRIYGGLEQEDAHLGHGDAELTVTFFNDIQCTDCADYQLETIDPLVEEYARPGEARLEYRHFSLAPNDTTLAAIAAEAAGEQGRQWQYLDLFARNQELAAGGVDEELLRQIAEVVPELDVDAWDEDFADPATEDAVREDAMLAAELELPAEPAVVVSGPGGQRELIESPSRSEIETAIAAVS
ncbi:MAG: DsbA family protein [Solirubrobacterales bacterium]